jgi:hypothetical protein
VVWVDWVILAFEYERGNVKNLNYEEEMEKLNNLKKQQLVEKNTEVSELVAVNEILIVSKWN